MAVKHSTRGWNCKKYAKQVLVKADLAVFWAQKEVVEPTTWVPNSLDGDQGCLSFGLVPMQMAPSMNILGTQTGQKKAFFGYF